MKVSILCSLLVLVLHIWSPDLSISPAIVLSQSLFKKYLLNYYVKNCPGFNSNRINLEKNMLILNECDPIVCFLVLLSTNSPES